MDEPYFVYAGQDSRDMGVVVEELPTIQRPRRKVTRCDVSGRDGPVELDDGGYDGYQTTMQVNVFGQTREKVFGWLIGEGWFVSSDEPDRAMWVSLDAQVKGKRFFCGECFDTLTVTLYIYPYRYVWPTPAAQEFTAFPATLTNNYGVASEPRIRIEATGDVLVNINAQQMSFVGLTDGIIVDSELMECLNLTETALLNSSASFTDFPLLKPGANMISVDGNVTKISITPRWRVL